MSDARHHSAERGKLLGFDQRFLGFPKTLQRSFSRVLGARHFLLDPLALGNFLGGDIDGDDLAAGRAKGMPIGDPETLLGLVDALAGHFDADDRFAGFNDGPYDSFDGVGESRDAVPYKTPEMILNGDTAYLGKALIYPQVATIRRETCEPNGSGIVNKLKRRLMRKQHDVVSVP